jgi:hypothetical protein
MDNYAHLKKLYDNARQINKERFDLHSKNRLIQNIEKKIRTTIIGTLARCEDQFGYLWGHGLEYNNLTTDQKRFRLIWEDLRTDILNHGNSQLRAAIEELSQYTITWNQYRTDFIVKQERK